MEQRPGSAARGAVRWDTGHDRSHEQVRNICNEASFMDDTHTPSLFRINRFAENAGCQQKCALALGNFACHEDNQAKIAQLDGITPIMAAMEKHSSHQLCLQYCW